jgi:hypothetical protein
VSAANRRRGADAERAVCTWLRLNGWPDARRYLAGDGNQPGDIDFSPGVCLEVKDVASSAWPTWRIQALNEARRGDVVAVVRRTRGEPDVGAWITHMPWEHWRSLDPPNPQPKAVACRRSSRMWAVLAFAAFADLVRSER